MRNKYAYIFTLSLLGTFLGTGVAYGQEEGGGELPPKVESTIIEKDSAQDVRTNSGESSDNFINRIVITPKTNSVNTLDLSKVPANNNVPKKPEDGEDKEEEAQSNLRFNFIYYLFYKFKVGSSTSGQ